jgi:hypothetical protein
MLCACIAAISLATRGLTAQEAEGFGVYANLGKVVFEPSEENPERVQIWGAFSVFAAGPNYQLRERGYLYFRLPTSSAPAAVRDWRALKALFDTRPEGWEAVAGTHAFMKPGSIVRVRTADEPPSTPDEYVPGRTPLQVSIDYGVPLNEPVMKPPHTFHYARVDDVMLEPAGAARTIQIRGVFSLGNPDGSYAPPESGSLYLALPADPQVRNYEWLSTRIERGGSVTDAVRAEWNDWKAAAGRRQVVKFLRYAHHRSPIRVRPASEPLAAPESYTPLALEPPFSVRSDTRYRPIRVLLDP